MATIYLCYRCLSFFFDEEGFQYLKRVAGEEDDEIKEIECSYCKQAREVEEVREE